MKKKEEKIKKENIKLIFILLIYFVQGWAKEIIFQNVFYRLAQIICTTPIFYVPIILYKLCN